MQTNTTATLREVRAMAGARGGRASAAKMTPTQRSERSALAGNATLRRFGVGYYSSLGKLSAKNKRKSLSN